MNSNIATLKDIKDSIEKIMKFIKDQLVKLDSAEPHTRGDVIKIIETQFKSLNTNLTSFQFEIPGLKNENTELAFKSELQSYKSEAKKLEEQFKAKKQGGQLQGLMVQGDDNTEDISKKKNNELTAQQLMNKGDGIVAESGAMINRIQKVVKDDLTIAEQIKRDLNDQLGKLDNVQNDLKEIDVSLGRAAKQIKIMFRMYMTDKIVLGLIFLIVIAILVIIIVAAVGGDSSGNFNVPHNIFTSGSSANSTTRMLLE